MVVTFVIDCVEVGAQKLEGQIEKLEKQRASLEAAMALASADKAYDRLQKLSTELAGVAKQLDPKNQRWMELADRA